MCRLHSACGTAGAAQGWQRRCWGAACARQRSQCEPGQQRFRSRPWLTISLTTALLRCAVPRCAFPQVDAGRGGPPLPGSGLWPPFPPRVPKVAGQQGPASRGPESTGPTSAAGGGGGRSPAWRWVGGTGLSRGGSGARRVGARASGSGTGAVRWQGTGGQPTRARQHSGQRSGQRVRGGGRGRLLGGARCRGARRHSWISF